MLNYQTLWWTLCHILQISFWGQLFRLRIKRTLALGEIPLSSGLPLGDAQGFEVQGYPDFPSLLHKKTHFPCIILHFFPLSDIFWLVDSHWAPGPAQYASTERTSTEFQTARRCSWSCICCTCCCLFWLLAIFNPSSTHLQPIFNPSSTHLQPIFNPSSTHKNMENIALGKMEEFLGRDEFIAEH